MAQDDEARVKAIAIRGRILAGEDFGKVAAEVSSAPSKATGGLIGPINVSELSDPLQNLLKTMKPGQVTAADPRGEGLPDPQARDDQGSVGAAVRGRAATSSPERVHTDRQRQEIRKFLARVRGQAIIEWKNAELKKAYDQLIVETAKTQG